MGKESKGKDDKLSEDMSKEEMVVKIMNTMIEDRVSSNQVRKIMGYVEKVVSEPGEKE